MPTAFIDPTQTIGALVAERPGLSKVFEQLGLDFCCGGKKTIAQACQDHNLAPGQIISALDDYLQAQQTEPIPYPTHSIGALAAHINDVHHTYLYTNMPRLMRMMDKVATVHGDKNPTLADLQQAVHQLCQELEQHMAKEERVLFPYCSALEHATTMPEFHCGSIQNPIRVMEREHDEAGALLAKIRTLTNDFTPPEWACNTYRALLEGLHEMEADLHQHIHKENNILFPLAIAKAQSLSTL
jgi:regulator of cell morphogenesis and NO signaling